MAKLQDYGIRFISHGEWSDPEIEWRKSNYQTYLFNYWDVAECTEYEKLCNSEDDADLQELVSQLWELKPSGFVRPLIDYEWTVDKGDFDTYDDSDYYKEYKLFTKEDFVLHNTSQALKQALSHIDDYDVKNAYISIYRRENGKHDLVANYRLQGSTLKDLLHWV